MRIQPTISTQTFQDRRRSGQERRAKVERRYAGPERRRARHAVRNSWLSAPFAAQLIGQHYQDHAPMTSAAIAAASAYRKTGRL